MDILRDHSSPYIPPAILFCFIMLLVVAFAAIGASVWIIMLYMSVMDFLHQYEGRIVWDYVDNEMGIKRSTNEHSAQVLSTIYLQEKESN